MQKKGFFTPLVLTVFIGMIFLFISLFFGLPLLAKLSLFLGKFSGEEINTVSDHTPPFPPQLEIPYTATNSARITLRGIAEPNSSVKLFLNEESLEKILIGKDGVFTKRIALKEDKNTISAQAIDQAGNKSKTSAPITILYKKTGPLLEIEFPDKEEFETEKEEIEIKGKTDPEVDLNINDRWVFVENDGVFNYLVSLAKGENLIEIIATDEAGNQTKIERMIIFSP